MGAKRSYSLVFIVIMVTIFAPLHARAQSSQESAKFRALFTQENVNRGPIAVSYALVNGAGFVIDRTNRNEILLKFDGVEEVWKLNSVYGSRGDEFLLNDVGETIIRITSLGGVTFYRTNDTKGIAASSRGKTRPILHLENVRNITLQNPQTIVDGALSKFREGGFSIQRVEYDKSLPQNLVKETINRVLDGFYASNNVGATRQNLKTLKISRAMQNYVLVRGSKIEIGVTPGIDYAGRPSSRAIQLAIIGH